MLMPRRWFCCGFVQISVFGGPADAELPWEDPVKVIKDVSARIYCAAYGITPAAACIHHAVPTLCVCCVGPQVLADVGLARVRLGQRWHRRLQRGVCRWCGMVGDACFTVH